MFCITKSDETQPLISHVTSRRQEQLSKTFAYNIDSVNNTIKSQKLVREAIKTLPRGQSSVERKNNLIKVTQNKSDLIRFQQELLSTAENILKHVDLSTEVLATISDKLKQLTSEPNRLIQSRELLQAKKFEEKLIKIIHHEMLNSNNRISLKDVGKLFQKELSRHLNNKDWHTIETALSYGNSQYSFILTPASQMKYCGDNHEIFCDNSYKGKGICSKSAEETTHAVNLWLSEVKDNNQSTLFSGIRHGVLSPYALPERSAARLQGAKNRAKEVVMAALFAKPELYKRALNHEEVTLRIASTSLLTYLGKEKGMLDDQVAAWKMLNNDGVIKLNIKNEKGEAQEVKVKLDIAIFNFGVNELAFSIPKVISQNDNLNKTALAKILGPNYLINNEVGGWVGHYLSEHPHASNRYKVEELCQQIKEIWKKKSYRYDGNEPYKIAQRIAMLAYEIGAVPCWNCKSGKDRTGMLDAEIKREAINYHQGYRLSKPGAKLTNEEKKLFQGVLLYSGNKQVQECNTGVAGNKVTKDLPFMLRPLALSYKTRIGDEVIRRQVQGFSSLV
ncbi:inositol phosphate phosphatase SopB [Providencia stuartii]|uniref:inositol phosphate phosphatase SopB n=1 Tax=Providencia stuartii TaxID=588 RepID=UPI00370BD00B